MAADQLKNWLVDTLSHLEWRSFVKSYWPDSVAEIGERSFIGEMPGVGIMIAFDRLVSKDELDRIRGAFASINRMPPTNSPVKFVEWVLDVPADRILDAADNDQLKELADDVEDWAFNVATVVDDVAQSSSLAEDGDWDASLRRVRRAIRKDGGIKNGYLYRLGAECSFSLGDWPGALRYSQDAVKYSQKELGSGYVRAMCLEADAHLLLGDVVSAWDKFSAIVETAPGHPLPRYYRGQALMLLARLVREFENERLRGDGLNTAEAHKVEAIMANLIGGATEDLTAAADLLATVRGRRGRRSIRRAGAGTGAQFPALTLHRPGHRRRLARLGGDAHPTRTGRRARTVDGADPVAVGTRDRVLLGLPGGLRGRSLRCGGAHRPAADLPRL